MSTYDHDGAWVFGYGSLVWRPDFPSTEVLEGWVGGWARRFWQGSPDHRGTPRSPGRVVTVVRADGAELWGRAYRVTADVLEHLDHRERAGYVRDSVHLHLRDGSTVPNVVLYTAAAGNPSFLGPAPLQAMAAQVAQRSGLSGRNDEYVLRLATALSAMGVHDPEVHDLAGALAAPPARHVVCTTCSAAKDPSPGPVPARVRYRSPRIDAVGLLAARRGLPFVILSGKLGLVAAQEGVEPYDQVLRAEDVADIARRAAETLKQWGTSRVTAHLRPAETPGWATYHAALSEACRRATVDLTVVLVGAEVLETPP